MNDQEHASRSSMSLLDRVISFCLTNKLVVTLAVIVLIGWGLIVAPFDWDLGGIPRDPVPVDAIPDISENQQIVFTKWMGRSPQDVEDQIGYPLTVSLLGIPGVKAVRSYSMFGFSTIYVIFKEDVDFYWSRSRILEKLNSLGAGSLPKGVHPTLGPDATALGQVFWYTLEGQDEKGRPTGGWDLQELRTIQDWYVRYSLMSADGIAEVASIGGFVREYQVDVDPDAMRAYRVKLEDVVKAVRMSNLDVGAKTIEVNKVEYVIRGIGFIKKVADIENAVIKVNHNVPVCVKDVAKVSLGPAFRRGALDKGGSEVVGGVVVVRYGENPLAAIKNVKKEIEEISAGLPKKVLPDGTVSQVTIVPFYDRTGLIKETLNTLNTALMEEVLVTVIVVILMLLNLRSSLLISGLLPLAILISFIAMKVFNVDANIVSLSGIAIAIGTMVTVGVFICENILKHLDRAGPEESELEVIFRAVSEIGSAVFTAVATTVVSFLPVFTMKAAEGKLFKPLAYTKTFALIASIIISLTVIPPFAHVLLAKRRKKVFIKHLFHVALIGAGVTMATLLAWWVGAIVAAIGVYLLLEPRIPGRMRRHFPWASNSLLALIVAVLLSDLWTPLGPEKGFLRNLAFVISLIGGVLVFFLLFQQAFERILRWCLNHKMVFMLIPLIAILWGSVTWLGFDALFAWVPQEVRSLAPISYVSRMFPGLGKEFMPPLDEGSYLFMPTTMPHASIGEALDVLQKQDRAFKTIPEINTAVGKLGRAETALDPAPISMIETIINYKPEYLLDDSGRRMTFRFEPNERDYFRAEDGSPLPAPDGEPYYVHGHFIRDKDNRLVPDPDGMVFRLWRPALDPTINPGREAWAGVNSPEDIWDLILKAAEIPGTTSAPKLQPIAARIVMLQSGMRTPMGVKVKGPDLASIEKAGLAIERFLKDVPSIQAETVLADRIVGKPYLEIEINRRAIARYGIMLKKVQDVIETAIGGKKVTTTVEGRERYPVRVRYMRELRDSIEELGRILVPAPDGTQIPLEQLVVINYVRGPQVIKSENGRLVGYVIFDKKPGHAEVNVVEEAQNYLQHKINTGELNLPPGVSYTFAGSYENQVRAQKRLSIILPLALLAILLILHFQFNSTSTTLLVFSSIIVAWAGGFIMIWLYGQPWFLDFPIFNVGLHELFQVHPMNLSVAIWVGFLALFGIASDNGVIMATRLDQIFEQRRPKTREQIREATVQAGLERIRPVLMTTAITILALIPVITSTGRGSDIMVPMAIPCFGGMSMAVISILVVPVLYSLIKELRLKHEHPAPDTDSPNPPPLAQAL